MLKQLLKKTLLAATGLCIGASGAWADLTEGSTTTVNFDGQTTPFVIHDSNRLGVSYAKQTGSETDYYANYTCSNKNALPFAAYDFSSSVTKAVKVDISFDCYFPNDNGIAYIAIADKNIHNATSGGYNVTSKNSVYGNNGAIWAFGRYRGKPTGSSTTSNYHKVNDTDKNSALTIATWYTVNVTVDLSTQKVSYTIKAKGGSTTLDSGTNMDYWNTGDGTTANACNQIDVSMPHTGSIYIDNINITPYTDESEKYASYTIKYKFGETELKSAVTDRDEVKVGEYATLISADKEAIWVESQKYIYESDDASSQAIAEDGSTVITVNFRKAGTYSYTLNAVDADDESDIIKELLSGTAVEGETTYTRGVKAFYQGGKLYSTTWSGGFEQSFTEAGTKNIPYSENTTWTYYAEAEEMTINGTWSTNGAYPGFYSNGSAKCLATGAYVYTDALTAGTYTVTAWARNNDKTNEFSLTLYFRDGDGNLTDLGKSLSWTSGQRQEMSVVDVVIPEGCSLVFKNDGGSNSKLEFDYIYLVKTAVPATVGANGYTTFASPYALDLTNVEGLKAYKATLEGATLKFEALNQTVAAGTGLLLLGETKGETYNIPIAANGNDVTTAFVGVTTPTDKQSVVDDTYYFVMKKATSESDPLAFAPLSTSAEVTIPAGKAYIEVPNSTFTSSARSLNIVFDDETTGINTILGSETKVNDSKAFYNLQGQRVAAPQKGLYIVNGKKVIVK